ncbi:MAG: hypothetical protein H8D78_06080 [Chloroflexi bacterium]|nr:hypothetical protein [Chloroflexota bacterium]
MHQLGVEGQAGQFALRGPEAAAQVTDGQFAIQPDGVGSLRGAVARLAQAPSYTPAASRMAGM